MSDGILTRPYTTVPVHCSVHEGVLGVASCSRATHGMGLWIAAIIHIVGVEIYVGFSCLLAFSTEFDGGICLQLRSTERANFQKIDYTLQPRDSQEESNYF